MDERQIVIGLITSKEYLQGLQRVWNPQFLESSTARLLASWCWEYFDAYGEAPANNITNIYYQKIKDTRLSRDVAEEIEQDILPLLSQEYVKEGFNVDYLLKQTIDYFTQRNLLLFSDTIRNTIELGKGDLHQRIISAERIATEYRSLPVGTNDSLNLNTEEALEHVERAFADAEECLIRYPRQLGEFWNDQLTAGSFVAFMGIEKRGKTYFLLDMAIRASRQKRKVVFFQAGDLTERQLLKRICVYLTQKSNLKRYCGTIWEPVRDCVYNQLDDCERPERECAFGVFENRTIDYLRHDITQEELIAAYQANPDYCPCSNCPEYETNPWGCPWIREVKIDAPLQVDEAKRAVSDFFIENKRYFKLSTHLNDTLTVKQIEALLDTWERQEQFVPDVIVIDYADLLTTEEHLEERPRQNKIWKGLRRLSQQKNQPLVVTATQANAQAYLRDRLRREHFSEDKRKYAHCTAMWGLNQDVKDREKHIGIMRLNNLVIREGEFFTNSGEVTVLMNLRRGRPFIASYW
ncbi:MAG TPA: hypothetical protein PLB70_07680 [Paludibacteraceae bacterium]|nr:hypothetical protein [Paludibacteraceae bacterium]